MKTTIINASELNIVSILSAELKKGCAITLITDKEPTMLKGTKNNRNPYLGRVRVVANMGGYCVGTDYSTSCENAVSRSGSTENFVAKQSNYSYYNDFFVTNKSGDKFYLQLQWSAKQIVKTEKTYYVDGHIATSAEIEDIKKWLPKTAHKQSSSQVESGITPENERHYIAISVANISYIKQGDFELAVDLETHKVEHNAVAIASR